MNKTELTKRALALFSASTIALTMGGCSKNRTNQNSNSSIISTVSEIDNSSDENISSIISSIVSASSEEYESKDVTTEIEETSKVEDTNSRVQDTSSRPQTSSKQESSSKEQVSSSKIETSSSNTLSSSTSSSTTSSNKVNKLTKDNINDVDAIFAFVGRCYYTIYNIPSEALFVYIQYEHDGQKYLCGDDEFVTLVALLNEEYMSNDTIAGLLGNKSFEEFKRLNTIIRLVIPVTYGQNDGTFLYENFVVDEKKQKFLIELQAKMKKHVKDPSNIECVEFLNSFYNGNNPYINHNDSDLMNYIVLFTLSTVTPKTHNQELVSLYDSYIRDYLAYDEYIEREDGFYSKTKSKQLVR